MKKYLWTISAIVIETVDGEEKRHTNYYDVVASSITKALEWLSSEKGVDLNTVDYATRKNEVPIAD